MKFKNKPLVSIVVPVYNAKKYLSECLSSLYAQTYKNIEIIIVDDGSTDGSKKIIDRYYKKFKNKTIVLHNKKASGSGEVASNGGIKLAKGKYVAIMDSDDISLPNRIEKEVNFLEKNKHYFLLSSSAEVVDESGKLIGRWDLGKNYNLILKKIFLTNSIINSSILFRKSEVKKDFYKIKYSGFNDYYTWIYYLSQGKKMHTLKDVLVKYRTSDSSSTRKNIKNTFVLSLRIKSYAVKSKMLRPGFSDRFLIFWQKVFVTLLPSKIINYLYLLRIKRTN